MARIVELIEVIVAIPGKKTPTKWLRQLFSKNGRLITNIPYAEYPKSLEEENENLGTYILDSLISKSRVGQGCWLKPAPRFSHILTL